MISCTAVRTTSFFGEVALRDAVHAFEDLKCIHKAAAGAVGKVDLSDVAGNDHF